MFWAKGKEAIIQKGDSKYGSIAEKAEYHKTGKDETESKRRCFGTVPVWLIEEFKELFSLAWYLSVINLFSNLMGTLSVTFCGHLGTAELDGVSLAVSLLNVFGICVANGLCTACDTLFSQSFGSRNKKKIGIYLQQSLLIIPLFVLPCWAIHLNMESVLVLLGNSSEVAAIAGRYLLLLMPGTLALFLLRIFTTFLRSQNVLWPTLVSGLIGTVTNIIGHVIALYALDTGIEGSAVVQSLSFVAMFAFTLEYILVSGIYQTTWPGWSIEAFHDWGRFLVIGVAGMLMLFASVFGQELGTFLAGALGETELGAQSILFNTQNIVYTIPFGFGIACNIRVGQLLGSMEPHKARRSTIIGMAIAVTTTSVIGAIGTLLRDVLPLLFTGDDAVIEMASYAYPVAFFFYITDGTTVCFLGVLRGCNKEKQATLITFIGYYVVGIPLCFHLMFNLNMGITGFWLGLAIGMLLNIGLFLIVLYRVDYDQEVKQALSRAGLDEITEPKPLGKTVHTHENKLLLSSYEDQDECEKQALLSYHEVAAVVTERRLKKFRQALANNNPYHSRNQLYVPVHAGKDLETHSNCFLVWTRFTFVALMVLLLVIGVVCNIIFAVVPISPTSPTPTLSGNFA